MSEHYAFNDTASSAAMDQPGNALPAEAFSFVVPVPVLNRRELLDYVECVQMDRWYELPVSFNGLARTYRAAVHHSSSIAVKRNILTSTFIPHPLLSQQAFSRFVQDYLCLVTLIWRSAPTGLAASFRWSHLWRNTPAAGSISIPTGLCSTA